ncbi:ARL14 effector protein [Platysternon megacephalum]|uniref:ARL14 effector protein n=1 Tax=Platysternon megacephalum TaxID=55544 RepID=A0A4D9EKH9_9SAUR|nr:ARL14 effector protein [Platysternon megacephalum]
MAEQPRKNWVKSKQGCICEAAFPGSQIASCVQPAPRLPSLTPLGPGTTSQTGKWGPPSTDAAVNPKGGGEEEMDQESQCRAGRGIKCKEDPDHSGSKSQWILAEQRGEATNPPPTPSQVMKWVLSALRKDAGLLISPPPSHNNEFTPLTLPGGMGASREDSETNPSRGLQARQKVGHRRPHQGCSRASTLPKCTKKG